MKQILFGLLTLLILSACSATKIHLFTQGMEPTELINISETLKEEGFRLRMVDLQPPDLANPSMIYSPAHPQIKDFNKIDALLNEMGYKNLDLIAVSSGNQSYTGRNVGLYLGKLDGDQNIEVAGLGLPSEFAGHCDESDAYLELHKSGEFDLNIIFWDESDKEYSNRMSGLWTDHEEYLALTFNESRVVKFKIEVTSREDEDSLYKKTQLMNIEPANVLAGCQFSSTLVSSSIAWRQSE